MINYKILAAEKLVVICNWGTTITEEAFKLAQNLLADPDFSLNYDAIVFNAHLESNFTIEEMHMFSQKFGSVQGTGKLAIVAPEDISHGMNRMFEILTEGSRLYEIFVFRNLRAALKWLGREKVDVDAICKEIMNIETQNP